MTKLLIVGSDSTIGRRVLALARSAGIPAVGTSRRAGTDGVVLDLAEPAGFVPPEDVNAAVLCAGVTSIAECHARPEETRAVNVLGVEAVARVLRAQGCHLTFLSTNMVFDGATPRVAEDAAPSPTTAYGMQKAEAEARLGELGGTAVLRLTKVLPPAMPLIADWLDAMRTGRPIRPHAGRVLAPVSLELTAQAILALATRRAEGLFHLSAARDVTYGELARWVAGRAGHPAALIEEVEPPPPAEPGAYPRHTCLAMPRLAALLGMPAPDPEAALSESLR